jgi:hypothetical protein
MRYMLTSFFDELSKLPTSVLVVALSVLGIAGIWMAMWHIDKHAGSY